MSKTVFDRAAGMNGSIFREAFRFIPVNMLNFSIYICYGQLNLHVSCILRKYLCFSIIEKKEEEIESFLYLLPYPYLSALHTSKSTSLIALRIIASISLLGCFYSILKNQCLSNIEKHPHP